MSAQYPCTLAMRVFNPKVGSRIYAWFGFELATMGLVGPTRPTHGPKSRPLRRQTAAHSFGCVGPNLTSSDTWRYLICGNKNLPASVLS